MTVVSALAGCTVPAVLTPRIEAKGVVLDQHNRPVPNATVRVSWLPVTTFPAMPTGSARKVQANQKGEWTISMRGVNQMSVRALPSNSYGYQDGKNYSVEIVRYGRQHTTNCVLRLEKTDE